MAKVKKRPQKRRKVKRKVVVKQKAKIAPKGSKKAKKDTLTATPTPRDNGATLKVKIKRK